MERGEPTITVYTFNLPQDSEPERTMQYPDAELWTTDLAEARKFARENRYQLIENNYLPEESELLEDYTQTQFRFFTADGADITGDAYQEDSAYRVEALDDDTVIAGVARDETGKWYRQQSLGHLVTSALSLNKYVTWRDAMRALDVGDFRELDD